MSHVKQQVREAAVTVLTGLTTTGANVFESRVFPIDPASLPALSVYTLAEESDPEQATKESIIAAITLAVEVVAASASDVDDVLDTSQSEIQVALSGVNAVSALSKAVHFIGAEDENSPEAEAEVWKRVVTYSIWVSYSPSNPEVAL